MISEGFWSEWRVTRTPGLVVPNQARSTSFELHPDIQFLPLYHGEGENQSFFCLWSFLWSKPLLCRFLQSGKIPQMQVSQGFAVFRLAPSRIPPRHSQSRRYRLRYTRMLNHCTMVPPKKSRESFTGTGGGGYAGVGRAAAFRMFWGVLNLLRSGDLGCAGDGIYFFDDLARRGCGFLIPGRAAGGDAAGAAGLRGGRDDGGERLEFAAARDGADTGGWRASGVAPGVGGGAGRRGVSGCVGRPAAAAAARAGRRSGVAEKRAADDGDHAAQRAGGHGGGACVRARGDGGGARGRGGACAWDRDPEFPGRRCRGASSAAGGAEPARARSGSACSPARWSRCSACSWCSRRRASRR